MGVKFAICSGRPVDSILPLLKRWGLEGRCDYIIGSNGGEVKDVARDKTVLSYTLSPQVLRDIMDRYEPLGLIPTLYDGTRLYVQRITAQAEKVAARLFVEPVKGDIRALSVHPEVKEMMVLDPALMAAAEAFAAAHPDPRYVPSRPLRICLNSTIRCWPRMSACASSPPCCRQSRRRSWRSATRPMISRCCSMPAAASAWPTARKTPWPPRMTQLRVWRRTGSRTICRSI
jgi:hypothetical protein